MKITSNDNATTTTENTSHPKKESIPPSTYRLSPSVWELLNLTTITGLTCAAVVAVQSPIKTVITTLTKEGNWFPRYPVTSIGAWGLCRVLYAGTYASLGGSVARGTYVTGAKIHQENTFQDELAGFNLNSMGYVATVALGDSAVAQIPESISQLRKIPHFLPSTFKWYTTYNLYQLLTAGFSAKYLAGLINIGSLCVLENELAKKLSIKNEKFRHFSAGALSGIGAGVLSYPFAIFRDYNVVCATVNASTGQLRIESTATVLKRIYAEFRQNPKRAGLTCLTNAARQVPIRSGLTGAIFSIVAGVSAILGNEPLTSVVPEKFQPQTNQQGFFYRKKVNNEVPSQKQHEAKTSPSPGK